MKKNDVKPTEQQPKKPSLWSRIANSKAVAKIGEVVGQAKFGQ